jgi:serine/threonine protein kinase
MHRRQDPCRAKTTSGLKLSEALNYALQIAEGLEAAHAAGIIHRVISCTRSVSPDGGRFLMLKESGPEGPNGTRANMLVILNWFEELKTKFGK